MSEPNVVHGRHSRSGSVGRAVRSFMPWQAGRQIGQLAACIGLLGLAACTTPVVVSPTRVDVQPAAAAAAPLVVAPPPVLPAAVAPAAVLDSEPAANPPDSVANENRPALLAGDPAKEFQRGHASWYGPGFHGRRTASGERFNMQSLTAAHRTLPFGTWVRVHSLVNGREVDVRITDRGPFIHNRIIDLSRAAAEELGMLGMGFKEVVLMVPESTTTPAGTSLWLKTKKPSRPARPTPPKSR